MAKRIKKTQIVDAVSGEILREDRETLYTTEAFKPGIGYRLYSRNHIRLGKWFPITIDEHQRSLLFLIVQNMDKDNAVPAIDRLREISNLQNRQIYRTLAALRQHGVIRRDGKRNFVNPAIAFSGTYLSPDLYWLFRPELSRIVPGWAKAEYEKERHNEQSSPKLH